ncbi:MAG: DUF2066 domain-containing protein [Woeseiaceae bacterium]|nr:DUF2066 domain-containing protein [Woeseiaceae bacterium]
MPTTRHLSRLLRRAISRVAGAGPAALAASLLLLAGGAAAVQVESLYTARVPLPTDEPDARDTAYERALQQVLIRVTGAEDAAFSPELKALFPNPARFVLQYRPGEDNTLWVSLDGAAIEKVLRQARLPVWGPERPLTVLWLAVDWGTGYARAADGLAACGSRRPRCRPCRCHCGNGNCVIACGVWRRRAAYRSRFRRPTCQTPPG